MEKLKFIMLYISVPFIIIGSLFVGIDFEQCKMLMQVQGFFLLAHLLIILGFSFTYVDDLNRVYLDGDITSIDQLYNHKTWFSMAVLFWLFLSFMSGIYLISYVWHTKNYITFAILELTNIKLIQNTTNIFKKYKELENIVKNGCDM